MGRSILFISKDRNSASTRYRALQFFQPLAEKGWRCDHHGTKKDSLIQRVRLLKQVRDYNLVVIQRKLFAPFYLRLLARANANIVFDYDDAVFLNDDGSPSPRRHQRFIATTKVAKLALAGNRYLQQASACKNTLLLPTGVDLKNYPDSTRPAKQNDTLTLIWIGSSATRKYLEHHRATLEAIGRQCERVKLKVIGDFQIDFDPLTTECIPWSAATEVAALNNADVGIAPMIDDPWTRGKCGLKVIQYMACGLPVLSSDVGANAEIVAANETGLLAATESEWIAGIEALRDATRRTLLGTNGRKRVEEYYSIDILAQRMDQAFTNAISGSVYRRLS